MPDVVSTPADTSAVDRESVRPWKMLVVDDEVDVHRMTRIVLKSFKLSGRPLQLVHAYSAAEAKQLIVAHPDTAVIMLDAVMETDDAGLQLAKWVREELGNKLVRIILRTGHPGQIPELDAVLNYDINDYKAKTDLTVERLMVCLIAALRCYQDICLIENSRKAVADIVAAYASLPDRAGVRRFFEGVLRHFISLLRVDEGSPEFGGGTFICGDCGDGPRILAVTGRYAGLVTKSIDDVATAMVREAVASAVAIKASCYLPECCVIVIPTHSFRSLVVVLDGSRDFCPLDKNEVDVFSATVGAALDNMNGRTPPGLVR